VARSFFRVVSSNPPTLDDFLSHRARGIPLRNPDEEDMWEGVSVQATEPQARRRARLPGFGRYIAELVIPEDGTIT